MFRFTHTAADEKAIKAVFTTLPETTPTAMHFNRKSAGSKGEERFSLNQIAFKTSVGDVTPDEAQAFVIARAAIAQHKRYQDHVATVGLPQETVTA